MPANTFALLFDLDGTLIDSAGDLAQTVNAILLADGLPPLTLAQITGCLGDGLRMLLVKTFALQGRSLSEADIARLMPEFEKTYRAIQPQPSCIYPGVIDFLKAQKARGIKLGLCTNKYEEATLRILKT